MRPELESINHPRLVQGSRMRERLHPCPPYAFMALCTETGEVIAFLILQKKLFAQLERL
jgi:hypothetical protein